ncbi:transporter, CPA2 family [Streptomyces sp. Ncost-T6T-1]|uniref:cation:proton antiporter n=1 Tax=Streptomyces sp. Ncost-T6T-1 TaxID=1100828 RepID=UPI000805B63E|nr:cation:proton antiporter [Streptomyces sp. Ncost-T6T-1]SBV04573.1 transporter, CPA2 family [Streptomyces sp. Ncost-T6T-1]
MTTVIAAGTVPAIDHHHLLLLFTQICVFLTAAVVLGRLAARVGLPAVVGELSVGVLLGPSLFGNYLPGLSDWLLPPDADQRHLLSAVAQLGVLLLVAVTGAHIDLGLLRRQGRAVGFASAGSVLLPLALGICLGLLTPDSLMAPGADRATFALFIGIALAVSALPVIAKTLLDMNLLHRNVGQLIIGAAAVSDIVGWLLLSLVSAMATVGVHAGLVAKSVGYLIAVLAFALLVARPVFARVLRYAARPDRPEGATAAVVALVMASAAATHALNMEPILGTFLCGIVIGSLGPTGRAALGTLRPFVMAVLAPLFFATAGLQVDLTALARPEVLAAAVVALTVATLAKFVGGYFGARAGRLGHAEGMAIGAGLNARGVMEIVLATVGLQLGVLTNATYTVIILIAVVTSVMAPPLLRRATRNMPTTTAEIEREKTFSAA